MVEDKEADEPTSEEIMLLRMIGGPFTDAEYVAANLPLLRSNHLGDGVYRAAHYPMATQEKR